MIYLHAQGIHRTHLHRTLPKRTLFAENDDKQDVEVINRMPVFCCIPCNNEHIVAQTDTNTVTNTQSIMKYTFTDKYLDYVVGNIVIRETIIVAKYTKKNSLSSTRATILQSRNIFAAGSFSWILFMNALSARLTSLTSVSRAT